MKVYGAHSPLPREDALRSFRSPLLGAKAHEELVRALRGRARLLEAHVRLEEGELFPLIALRAAIRRKQRLEAVPATRELMDAGAVEL